MESMLLIRNGLIVDTEWSRREDILVKDGKILRTAKNIPLSLLPPDTEIVNADGLLVLPGFIDAHTHYGLVSRGTVTADSFKEGSRCAITGGITTVIDFADDDKVHSLKECAENRIKEMKDGGMAVDFSLHQGVYHVGKTTEKELKELASFGIRTIKIFTTYRNVGYLVENKEELVKLFKFAKKNKILITAHCEDNEIIEETERSWQGSFKPTSHPLLRSSKAEALAIRALGEIALQEKMPLYIVHVSSEAGLEEVYDLREEGAKIFIETTPTYLFADKSLLVGKSGALAIMTPPLRSKKDNAALSEALEDGDINVVATDHCAFTAEQKLKTGDDCRHTYPGVPGSQEMSSLLSTYAATGGLLNMQQIVNLISTSPAKLFGLYPKKGALHIGSDADIVLFDPEASWKVTKNTIQSASGYSIYEGRTLIGKVKMTYLRGRLVYGEDVYLGRNGSGEFVKQNVSAAYKYLDSSDEN